MNKTQEQIKEKFYTEFPHKQVEKNPIEASRALGFLQGIEFVRDDMQEFITNYKKIIMLDMVKIMLHDLQGGDNSER